MQWFASEFGCEEGDFQVTQQQLFSYDYKDNILTSSKSKQTFFVGEFTTPSVGELAAMLTALPAAITEEDKEKETEGKEKKKSNLAFLNITGDVRTFHRLPENAGAVFQVASQFNCLEMVGPGVTPQHGVTGYAMDHTQGPACALSCPAGTVYRNYFVPVNAKGVAQTSKEGAVSTGQGTRQIDTLYGVGEILGNNGSKKSWDMKNGYCLPVTNKSIAEVGSRILSGVPSQEDALSGSLLLSMTPQGEVGPGAPACPPSLAPFTEPLPPTAPLFLSCLQALRVGVHWDTEVSVKSAKSKATEGGEKRRQSVCQVYASAVPVAYAKSTTSTDWQPFASLVLQGAYLATFAVAAVLAAQRKKRVTVYLTSLGGGAFGNRHAWIVGAVRQALQVFRDAPLDVRMVNYSAVRSEYKELEKTPGIQVGVYGLVGTAPKKA
uniref:Uncharacterized protein n=1 Tax=Chromera velia CCMP2878 TaxID=1169474 RepID=A0A0G4HQF2_9ALVE|eukprot:Cvel_7970.t1-p1 / transcript=Cvel_7970.t1 / gene=Cvel_7970 / organism=Chromera_velia_CCMP2878 / gene_product=hypothetical protein / transcript_product=hypothetical protein / location=Cvel_scaffold429:18727-20028(-) / protein_length=434 / sequence_SO=supercontig / SO=protein_coding / is_pseudo=false